MATRSKQIKPGQIEGSLRHFANNCPLFLSAFLFLKNFSNNFLASPRFLNRYLRKSERKKFHKITPFVCRRLLPLPLGGGRSLVNR